MLQNVYVSLKGFFKLSCICRQPDNMESFETSQMCVIMFPVETESGNLTTGYDQEMTILINQMKKTHYICPSLKMLISLVSLNCKILYIKEVILFA